MTKNEQITLQELHTYVQDTTDHTAHTAARLLYLSTQESDNAGEYAVKAVAMAARTWALSELMNSTPYDTVMALTEPGD